MARSALAAVLRFVVTVLVFALGAFGFHQVYHPQGGATFGDLVGDAIKSLELVAGRFPDNLADKPLPISLQIARIGLPVMAIWTTAGLAWGQAKSPLRAELMRRRGGHLVVAGDETLAGPVALNERKGKRPLVLWVRDPAERWVQAAADHGAAVIARSETATNAVKLGLENARGLLLVGRNANETIALATSALNAARPRAAARPLTVIARVDDPDLRAPLEHRFLNAAERGGAQLRFASVPAITARRLFLEQPVDRFQRGEDQALRIFFVGFSASAERYALQLLAGVHPRGGRKPALIALDPNAKQRREVFFARRPGAAALAPVAFMPAAVDQPSLIGPALDRAIDQAGLPTSVVVDLDIAERNTPAALAIADYFLRKGEIAPPIYAHAADGGGEDAVLGGGVIPFGALSDLADPEWLLQEKLDRLARSIHQFYFEGRLEEGETSGVRESLREWEELPESVRDDNRLVSDCYEMKLRSADIGILPGRAERGALQLEPDTLEELSRAEHDRWMAAKRLGGWVHGEQRDDARRLHPDIVPYDDLSEPRKDLDREQIRAITRLLGVSDRHALRNLTVLVEAPAAALSAGLPAALAGLADIYPDRRLVLLGAFEDADVRAALARAEAGGAAVRLLLCRNATMTLWSQSRDLQAAGNRLLRRADRIYALDEKDWDAARRAALARARADVLLTDGPRDGALPTIQLDQTGRIVSAPWAT